MQDILEGSVIGIEGEYAKIRPRRHTECDDCQACHAPDLLILAYNPKKAEVGQNVTYIQAQSGMLLIAWVLFLQPLLAVFLGIGLGSLAAASLSWPSGPVMGLGALLFLAIAIVYIRWFDRRYKLNNSNFAKITEIIP